MYYVGHANGLAPALSARRNLSDWLGLNAIAHNDKDIEDALAQMDAVAFADTAVRHLSFGQARRVALARLYLGSKNALWLLDEPNAGLDRDAYLMLEKLVANHLRRGGLLSLRCHDPSIESHHRRSAGPVSA